MASDAPNIIVGIDPDDTVTITFSEVTNAPVIDDTNIDSVLDLGANSWKDGASAIGSAVWSGGDTILTVTLSDATSDPTVAVSDTITLDGATVTDGTTASVNVAFSSITGTFSADTTPPDISTLTTADIDADGYIDRLIVTFDEAVDDTTMVGAGFSTDIGSVASVVDDGTSQDTVIWVNITDAVLATDQVPQLTIAATSIKDLPGTWNVLISNAVSADSAAPVIMSVSGVEGTTTLTATFSEPVDTSNAGAGDLIGTDFGYADGNAAGATGITSIGADADGTDSTVSIAVNATLVAGDTADSVAAVASEIFDLADNGAGVAAKAIAIDELPELSSVITTDVDGDGYTDRLVATFDENVDEATIAPASFTVNLGSVATVVDDGVASDATIWVNLTDGALATDAVPQLSIAAGGIKDTAGNANATISNYASTDGAAPRLMSAAAVEGSTSATVTFSEAVDTSNVGAGDSADSIPATAAQIYDLSNNAALTTGVSMAVDQLPELSSVTTVDSDGDGYVDRLIAVFDENVDESTIVPASFTTSAGSVTTVVDDGTGGNAVIHVELTDGSLATDSVPLLSIAVDGIKDLAGNGNAAITNYASTDGAGPAILSAAASDETNILVGVDNDDRVVITFSEATNQPAVSAGNIDTALALSGGHSWLDGAAAITSAAWSGATVLTVTLSDTTSDPTAVAGDTITLDGTTITDGTNNGTTVASGAIIGTFSADSTPPSLSTVTTADTDSDGYIDRLVATFAENVDATTITAAKFSTNIGTVSTLVDDGVLSNAVIYVDMSDGALLSDAVPLLSIAVGGIKDLPGNENATITDFASTDAAAPVILSATGVATQTTLTVTFSEPVDTSNAGAGNLVLGDFSYADGNAIGATVLSVTGDADGTDEVVTITVNGGFDPSDMGGDTLAAVAGQIYDLSDNAASTGAVALQTSDLTTPTITVRETKDLDGDGSIDALKISFDEPVLDTSVTSANFDIAGVAGEGFSSTTAGDIADNSEIYITFADGVLATDATPNVTYTAGTLTDLAANALASTGAVASVDAAGPAILSAVASDETNISVGVDSDDSVTVTFSEATNAPVINAAGIDTVLDLGGNTWKDGALSIGSAVWSGGNTILTITLSDATSDPTVAVSDTISLDGSTITDGTTASATVAFSAIGGTFSADSTAPSLSAVTTADTDGDGYIDRLVATFDENVDDTVLVPASFTTNIGSVATVTDDGVSQDAVIWVELTDGAQASDAVPLLSIAAAGITDLPGNANIIITDYASTDAAGPGILSAVASDESNIFVGVDSDDTVTITFSEATNGAVISAANIDTVLDLGANSWRDGASAIGSAAWSGGDTVLTITLSDATGDPSVVVSDAITLDGSTITDGTAASTNVAFSAISGTFSADATAPSLSTLTTADTDTDGYIDRLIATFDENVDDTVLVPAGFTTNIGSVSTVTDNGASKDAVIWVELTDGVLTTDAVPLLSVAAAGITDVPGNAYAIIANYASTDSTAPAIIARETADLDEDGSIDALHITLSEAISDASVTAADFDVAGVTGEAFSSTTGGDTADDSDIYITFTDAVLATDSVPNLTYTAGTLADANANIMNTNGPVVSIDKAGPVILSVVASDAANIFVGIDNDDTVTVTLSESTNKAAITSVNINSAMTLSGGHTWRDGAAAITSAVWNGSGDVLTVTLSDTGSDPTVAVGDTIILDGTTITDGTNGSVTAASASMAGTFSADTTAPSLASVTTADTDGDGYIDRLNATFDENVDESTIVPARYSVSLGSVASVVDDGTSQNAVIWVNLSDGVLTTDVTPQLTIAAGGIKDLPGNANVLISNYGSTDSAGPAILAAMAADNASVIVGVDGDDSVTLSFSETTNSPAINAGNINTVFALSSGHGWLDGVSAITAATWTDARTLEITLSVTSGAPTVAVADTITLDGVTVTDGTNSSTTVASSSIGGTFSSDSTPPALLTVTTGDTDTDGYIDRLVATFDENVDEGTIISARFSTDVGSVASVIDDGVASSAIIWINLTDGVLYSDATPQLTITARGIEDIPGNGSALISNFASIDNAAPVIHSVSGIAAGTTLTVRFSEAVDTSNAGAGDLVPADFSYADNSGTDAGAISSMGGDADATDGQITLTVDAALAAGDFGVDTVSAAAAQIYDLADNAASAAPFTLATSDVTAPTITARETRDLNGDGYIEAIRIALDEPILDSTVSAADFDVAGVTGEAFSSTTAGDVADNNELYLTFDDGILTTAAAPNITYTAGTLSDFASNLLASNGPVAATDSAGPAIVGAVASDEASVLVGVDADDTVTITFSEATDKPVITNININSALTLSSGHSWLDGSGGITSAAWDAPGSALTVTLSNTTGEPTIVAGDSMTLDGSTIKDGGGNGGTTVPSGAISGTFSADSTAPSVSGVVTQDTDSDGYVDRLVASFTENVDAATIAAGNFSTDIGTVLAVTDDGTALDPVIHVELTDGVATSGELPKLSIAAGGIEDLPGNANALVSNYVPTDAAGPAIVGAVASDEPNVLVGIDNDDTVTITFSEATNKAAINNVNIDSILDLGANSWLDGASGITSAAWNGAGDTLTVTLSVVTIDPTVVVGDTITLDGATITDGTNASVSVAYSSITGSFSADTTPPTLNPVSVASDNLDTAFAKVGDTVTMSFTASEALNGLPTVTIDGNAADSVNDLGSNNYTATRLMQTGDTQVAVSFTIDFTDAAGNAGAQVTAVTDATSVTFDETVPAGYTVVLDQAVVNTGNKAAVSFTFAGAEVGADYSYSIDDTNGATAAVSGSGTIAGATDQVTGINVSSLDDDTLTLTVYLTDGAGNQGTNATDTVGKETTAPALSPVSISSNNADATLAKVGDTVTVSFSSDETLSGLPTVTIDGNAADAVNDLGGNNYTATRVMQAGDTSALVAFTIDFADGAGNTGPQVTAATDATNVTFDETAPAGYTVVLDQAVVNASNEAAVSFTFAGAEAGAAYNYSIDDTNGGTAAVSGSGTTAGAADQITLLDVSGLDDDTLTLTVYLTDGAGNQSADATDTAGKDATVPTLAPGSIASDNADTTLAKAGETVTVSFTTSETLSGPPTVTIDGNAADAVSDLGGNAYTATRLMQAGDTEAAVSFTIDITDAAGNAGAQVTAVSDATGVVFDGTPPSGYTVSIDQATVIATNETAVSFTFAGSEVGADYSYSIDDTNAGTTVVTGTGAIATVNDQITGIDVSSLDDDTLTLTVYLTDASGNQGINSTDTKAKDALVPILTAASMTSDNADTSQAKVGDTVTISFTASEVLGGMPTVALDGNAADSVNDLGSNNYTATRLMQTGDTAAAVLFTIDFTDVAGNAGAQVTTVTDATSVTFDETTPAGYTAALDQTAANAGNETAMSFTFAGAEVGTGYGYSIDDTNGGTTAVTGIGTIATTTDQITGIDVSGLDDDTLTLTVSLTDGAGNQGLDVTDTVTKDTGVPSGYSVGIDQTVINAGNETAMSFIFVGAEVGAGFTFSIDDTNGATAPVIGSGPVVTATDQITSIDVSTLDDDALTLTVYITDASGNQGADATDTVSKDATLPQLSTLTTSDVNGNGYVDRLIAAFDEAVDETTIVAASFAVSVGTVESVIDDGIAANAVIWINLPDGVLATDATPQLNVAAGGINDLAGNQVSLISNAASSDGAGPAVISAAADDNGAVFVGIDADDTVTITFSEATNKATIDAANIETALALGNGHSWLDGAGAITSAVWNLAGDVLTVVLSDTTSDPTIAEGDTISLDGTTITDGTNGATTIASAGIAGSFSGDLVAPTLAGLTTADSDGDGYIDRLVATFDEPVDETTVLATSFATDVGSATAVEDDGTPLDAVIWVQLADDELTTDVTPKLSITAGGIKDVPGNENGEIIGYQSADAAAPVVLSTWAILGEKSVYIQFSEEVSAGTEAVSLAQFSYSDADNQISSIVHVDKDGIWSAELYLFLTQPLDSEAIFLPHTLSPVPGEIVDRIGIPVVAIPFEVTDLALGVVQPVWATDGEQGDAGHGTNTVRKFDGTEVLVPSDITLQVHNDSPYTVSLVYEVVPIAQVESRSVAPKIADAFQVSTVSSAPLIDVQNNLYTFYMPLSEIHNGGRVNFMLKVGDVVAKRLINPKDPSVVSLWSFVVQPITRQRGNVTILNNKIDPDLGEQARVIYTLSRSGPVMIVVTDAAGNIVDVLKRESQDAGEYNATWDGRNRGNRKVAPGLYFVKVLGPDVNEIRKVLVTRRRR